MTHHDKRDKNNPLRQSPVSQDLERKIGNVEHHKSGIKHVVDEVKQREDAKRTGRHDNRKKF